MCQNHQTIIYKLTNKTTGKSYIGKTINLAARLRKHKSDKHCILLHQAIQEYGFDNFIVTILHKCRPTDDPYLLEKSAIIDHNTLQPYGYNILPKDGPERQLPEDSIKKLSKSLQGRNLNNTKAKYTGVRLRNQYYEMRLRYRGYRFSKLFPNEMEAAEAYDKLSLFIHGSNARLNFEEKRYVYLTTNLEEFYKLMLQKKWTHAKT